MRKIGFVVVVIAGMIGCGEDPPAEGMSCVPAESDGTCGRVEVCCTSTECEYRADGVVFPCAGSDCGAAASDVTDYCS